MSTVTVNIPERRDCPYPRLTDGDTTVLSGDSGAMGTLTAIPDHHWPLPGEASASLCRRSASEAAAGAALAILAGPWRLAVLDGPDHGLVMAVKDGIFLGRGEVLSDPLIFHYYLCLRLHDGRTLARGYGSANGSYRYWYLGLWLRVCRETRMKERTLLRLRSGVLELRRHPCDLVVAAPTTQVSSTA